MSIINILHSITTFTDCIILSNCNILVICQMHIGYLIYCFTIDSHWCEFGIIMPKPITCYIGRVIYRKIDIFYYTITCIANIKSSGMGSYIFGSNPSSKLYGKRWAYQLISCFILLSRRTLSIYF